MKSMSPKVCRGAKIIRWHTMGSFLFNIFFSSTSYLTWSHLWTHRSFKIFSLRMKRRAKRIKTEGEIRCEKVKEDKKNPEDIISLVFPTTFLVPYRSFILNSRLKSRKNSGKYIFVVFPSFLLYSLFHFVFFFLIFFMILFCCRKKEARRKRQKIIKVSRMLGKINHNRLSRAPQQRQGL